ncbi:hypothetical protein PR003_g29510 [Phytophthora rubi]|uniref:Uncharacterized protein n=1 Tax=Phytophthora rubi TaxID=129364 RepID=A0A6A4BGY8_9STRA|nr:hypothetical protein PR003_g29510 [Phytophthora rubi]
MVDYLTAVGRSTGSASEEGTPSKLLLRMKLLWISDHAYGQWKLIRMHFVDAQAPETLDDMLSVSYEDNR